MRRYFAFSITFLLPFLLSLINSANAQNSVSGVLTASDNDSPLPYANIYLSNTTIGTSSDPDGFFSIRNIPPGRYELVVQYVGYELFVKNIDLSNNDKLRLNVKLVPKPYAGEEVVVEAPDAKWWRKRLEEFTREFMGPNPFASECRILNATALEFAPAPEIDGYKVVTDSIIAVENRALGYKVYVTLVDFKWGYYLKHPVYQLKMHTRFEKLAPGDEKEQEKWRENRKKSYEGSLKHFLKALATGRLDNHFTFKEYPSDIFNAGNSQMLTHIKADEAKMLGPKEFKIIPFEDPSLKKFYLDGVLEINYFSGTSVKKSYLSVQGPYALIDTLGGTYDVSVLNISGDWANTRIAGMLPADYRPAE